MNKKVKNKTNKVIIMIVIIMLFNFVMPNYSHAGLITDWVTHKILDAFAELLLVIPDNLFGVLQGVFLGDSSICNTDKNIKEMYAIKLSPGTIFAGKIPAFDIDFINAENIFSIYGVELYRPNVPDYELPVEDIPEPGEPVEDVPEPGEPVEDVPEPSEPVEEEDSEPQKERGGSIAGLLKTEISTWYNVLKNVALVALLSILVYIAIRMIISSAAKDKAKYKKMLGNWFAAICLLFILHFMISLMFTATRSYNRYSWRICCWS